MLSLRQRGFTWVAVKLYLKQIHTTNGMGIAYLIFVHLPVSRRDPPTLDRPHKKGDPRAAFFCVSARVARLLAEQIRDGSALFV